MAIEGERAWAADTHPPPVPSGDETRSRPAMAPAGRCPARSPRRPPPETRFRRSASWLRLTRGSISGVMRVASGGIRFAGTSTSRVSRADHRRQLGERLAGEQRPHVRVQPREAHPLHQRHGEERVSAEFEEVVVCVRRALSFKHLGPDPAPAPLRSPLAVLRSRASRTPSPSGARQRPAIDLPVGRQRQRRPAARTPTGTMYSGSPSRAWLRSASAVRRVRARVVGHQALVAGLVFPGQHHRLATLPPALDSAGFDLPELDAESADLHLKVVSTEILDVPVGQPPAEVSRPVHPRFGVPAERIAHEALGRQRRPVQVPATDGHAADMTSLPTRPGVRGASRRRGCRSPHSGSGDRSEHSRARRR